MRLAAFFILLLAMPVVGGQQPPYEVEDPAVAENFREAFLGLTDLEKRLNVAPSLTKAELTAKVPDALGQVFYCSDCSTDALVVSTGPAQGAFARVSARSTGIN
jgi:hypothetical protein